MKLVPYAFSALKELEWLEEARKQRRYWIVGPEYSDSEKEFRVLYNALSALGVPFDHPGTYNNPQNGDMHISLWGGKFMVDAMSSKYPETLVGEGLSGVVLSEAAKIRPTVYPKFLRPALADWSGWTYMGSTPEGRNWFYDRWDAGQSTTRPDWRSWKAPSWVNPHVYRKMKDRDRGGALAVDILLSAIKSKRIPERLPVDSGLRTYVSDAAWAEMTTRTWKRLGKALGIDPEITALALDLSEELFKQEVAAEFNEYVGRVLKDFDEEIHVADLEYDPTWATYAAIDYGFTNPFVWLLVQIDPFGENVRIIDEYYETGRTTEEAAREIRERGLAPSGLRGMYPDPAEPDRSKTLADLLQVPAFGGTGGEIKDRIEWFRRLLRPDPKVAHLPTEHEEWVPRIQINRRCTNTIREFGTGWRYPKTAEEAATRGQAAPELPLKKDDHTPEAFGRFLIGHFGSPWALPGSAVRQRKARVGRSRR